MKAIFAPLQNRIMNAEIVGLAGMAESKTLFMGSTKMIKLFYDYEPSKDGYMGPANRRYWLVNTATGYKLRISSKQYDKLLNSWEDIWDGKIKNVVYGKH